MAEALTTTSAWESIHGQHHVPKGYVPPFLKDDLEVKPQSPEKIRDKIYDLQIEEEALNPIAEAPVQKKKKIDLDQVNNLETMPFAESDRRQIKDMKFIRIKVKQLHVESEDLIAKLTGGSFTVYCNIPLPDIYQKKMSEQKITLSNYEILQNNLYAFNSLSLYNFRIDEATLGLYVASVMKFGLVEHDVYGSLNMNKLIMAHDFKLETEIDLTQKITQTKMVKVEGRKQP